MATFRLTPFRDVFSAPNSSDRIHTYDGNDTIWANGGNDTVYGGNDIDWLFGGSDNDRLYGKLGEDWLAGDSGDDYIDGGRGNDRMEGGTGNDSFIVSDEGDLVIEKAGEGTDRVTAYLSQDMLGYKLHDNVENVRGIGGFDNWWYAVWGNNLDNHIQVISRSTNTDLFRVFGRDGDDTLVGSNTADWLEGGDDDDTLLGNAGNDKLYGDNGDDILEGGSGNDTLRGYGGANDIDTLKGDTLKEDIGRDTFVLAVNGSTPYANGPGHAIIQDFDPLEDKIQLGSKNGFTLRQGNYDNDLSSDDTAIFYGSPNSTSLVGIVIDQSLYSLNESYFV